MNTTTLSDCLSHNPVFFLSHPFPPKLNPKKNSQALDAHSTRLVVEEADVLLHKGDAQLLGGVEDGTVVLAAAGGSNVLDARAGRAEDIVNEGEL